MSSPVPAPAAPNGPQPSGEAAAAPRAGGSAARAAWAGLAALAVAVGIGRFVFTPLLPLMQGEGLLDLAQGAWLASANYAGYLVGALSAAWLGMEPRRLLRGAGWAIVVLTAAMAATDHVGAWLLLRFLAGAVSAWVMVATSAWALAELAARGRGDLGGTVYAGVGSGIALAGLACLLGARLDLPSPALWCLVAGLGAVLCLALLWLVPSLPKSVAAAAGVAGSRSASEGMPAGQWGLVLVYGCFGFGYILPATFLPALARTVVDDPALFGWSWPVFGAAAALSTWIAGRFAHRVSRIRLWAAGQGLMALGTALPGLWPGAVTVLLSAVLVGGTFMVVTMAGLQEGRLRGGANPTRLLGRLTAAFALGQIAGPLSSALLAPAAGGDLAGMRWALLLAAAVLAASAFWLLRHEARTGAH